MNTVKKEQRTFIERLYCDCGAEMKPTGIVYSTYPPKYEYECTDKNNCRVRELLTTSEVYPKITYEDNKVVF